MNAIDNLQYQIDKLRKQSVRSEVTGSITPLTESELPAAGQAGRLWFVTDILGGVPAYDDGVTIRPSNTFPSYTVAALQLISVETGSLAWASDGLKAGETAGNGTGIPCYFDGSNWYRFSDDTVISA